MSKRKIPRGEAIWAGGMIGVWLALAASGVWRIIQEVSAGEPPWLGILLFALASFWISKHAIKIIDYRKQ